VSVTGSSILARRLDGGKCACQTARYAGLLGWKNEDVLDAAEAAGFDVLVTVDQTIPGRDATNRPQFLA